MKSLYMLLFMGLGFSATAQQGLSFNESNYRKVLSFQLSEEFGSVKLSFNAVYEEGIISHEVQRSSNGIDFTSIGTLSPELNNRTDFIFTDATPLNGINYYRIKTNGANRAEFFSAVRKAEFGMDKTDLLLTPNPVVTRELNVLMKNFSAGQYTIELFNSTGTRVYVKNYSQSAGNESETISLPTNIAAGMYTLQVKGKSHNIRKTIQVVR